VSRDSSSGEVLKPSLLDGEQIEDRPSRLQALPPYIHLTSTWHHSPMNSPIPSPFFTTLPLPYMQYNAN